MYTILHTSWIVIDHMHLLWLHGSRHHVLPFSPHPFFHGGFIYLQDCDFLAHLQFRRSIHIFDSQRLRVECFLVAKFALIPRKRISLLLKMSHMAFSSATLLS
jgi:hypothetical protein